MKQVHTTAVRQGRGPVAAAGTWPEGAASFFCVHVLTPVTRRLKEAGKPGGAGGGAGANIDRGWGRVGACMPNQTGRLWGRGSSTGARGQSGVDHARLCACVALRARRLAGRRNGKQQLQETKRRCELWWRRTQGRGGFGDGIWDTCPWLSDTQVTVSEGALNDKRRSVPTACS